MLSKFPHKLIAAAAFGLLAVVACSDDEVTSGGGPAAVTNLAVTASRDTVCHLDTVRRRHEPRSRAAGRRHGRRHPERR